MTDDMIGGRLVQCFLQFLRLIAETPVCAVPKHDRKDAVAVVDRPSGLSQISEENRAPMGQRSGSDGDIRRHPSQYLASDNGADLTETPRDNVSGRARRSPLGSAEIKIVRTPARRPRGGRGSGKPPVPGRSERKPPRYYVSRVVVLLVLAS